MVPITLDALIVRLSEIEQEQLLSKLKEGSREGFDLLYKSYSGALLGIALRIIDDRQIAEDVLHDGMVKIWKGFAGYDETKGRLFTWMARIIKNTALDHVKSKASIQSRKTDSMQDVVAMDRKGGTVIQNTDVIGIRDWMEDLRPEQKEVIESLYYQGHSQSQAAEELDIPLGTVKTRLRSALLHIRKKLDIQ